MRYYVAVLTQLLTVSQQYNSFLSAFLPMAMESTALAEALVAWSSGHLPTLDPSYRVTALEARSKALCALLKSISSTSNDVACHETNAATCLALLTSEVCLGDRTGWYNHLLGVKHIIMSAQGSVHAGGRVVTGPEAFKRSPEGQWVLRNFAYHDILGSVTLDTKPLLGSSYLKGIMNVVDTYLGAASEILIFIADISSLSIPRSPSDIDYARHGITFQAEVSSIEKRIQNWRCHPDTIPSLAAVVYAYRSAALIYLYQRVRAHRKLYHVWSGEMDVFSTNVATEVSNVLNHISNIPMNDIPESALLFPLFLAGAETVASAQINMVRTRLQMMLNKRRFQYVSLALETLEDLWSRNYQGADSEGGVDWKDVLRIRGGGLLLT